jgi:hypothetical protein
VPLSLRLLILFPSQYAVTDSKRVVQHGQGVPGELPIGEAMILRLTGSHLGIFFKFDLEALGMTIRERTTSLYQLLIRLAGVIGAYPPS